MKKFLTLVLALVMALAIALPAMAFTSDTTEPSTASPYELDIYLVEYEDNDFFGITTLPPSDRGYAKNEVVAAVVELYVPKNEDLSDDGYSVVVVEGEDVTFNVTDNAPAFNQSGAGFVTPYAAAAGDGNTQRTFALSAAALDDTTSNRTFKLLVFAKVTGDEASLTASLIDKTGNSGFTGTTLTVVLDGDTYTVTKNKADGAAGNYTVTSSEGNFKVFVDKNYKSTGLSIANPATSSSYVPLGFTMGGVLGVVDTDGIVKTSGDLYEDVMDQYDDVVKGVFGLDFTLIGNYVRDSFWTGLTSGSTISATVEIKPWTAYVTVPDNIVVDPPKTGDAASIVGFVMIVLAAAAVVAVKKVRA